MSTLVADTVRSLPAFQNEPVADFSKAENRQAAERALAGVRVQAGHEYDLRIAGRRAKTGDLLTSLNPSHPSEVVGLHHKATAELANEAIEKAAGFFPQWAATPPATRVDMLLRASAGIRRRKMEFDAWLVVEAG